MYSSSESLPAKKAFKAESVSPLKIVQRMRDTIFNRLGVFSVYQKDIELTPENLDREVTGFTDQTYQGNINYNTKYDNLKNYGDLRSVVEDAFEYAKNSKVKGIKHHYLSIMSDFPGSPNIQNTVVDQLFLKINRIEECNAKDNVILYKFLNMIDLINKDIAQQKN